MSNPAVVKLSKGRIGNSEVWLDDNYGESIHIHVDDHRIDLTVEEFEELYNDLCSTLNESLKIPNLDFKKIDPVYFSLYLWPKLDKLIEVKIDKVRLGSLLAPYNNKIYKLSDSVGVKYLQGVSNENEGYRKSHHIGQTDKSRIEGLLHSIKEKGYPYDNKYIIVYGNDNVIRDGQHRASCLYYLKGDIDVPIMRFYFRDYKPLVLDRRYNAVLRVAIRNWKASFNPIYKKFIRSFYTIIDKTKRIFVSVERYYTKLHVGKVDDLSNQFNSK